MIQILSRQGKEVTIMLFEAIVIKALTDDDDDTRAETNVKACLVVRRMFWIKRR